VSKESRIKDLEEQIDFINCNIADLEGEIEELEYEIKMRELEIKQIKEEPDNVTVD